MTGVHHTELVVGGLLVACALLAVVAQFVRVPYPILFVLGGLAIGLVPGLPRVSLNPDLVFLIMLPPLVYSAAFFISVRELRRNVRPISLLAVGLMLTTMVVVAGLARAALGFSWPAAFVLGAVLAPTDPLAATSVLRRLSVPRRIVTVVEAESLFNDGTALVAYRAAVAAVTAGAFSLSDTLFRVIWTVALGVAIGLVVGWIAARVRRRLDDPPTEIAISLITPYLAYLPADAIGASGVLAVLTVGLYLGWRTPLLVSPTTRIQNTAAWEVLVFALNGTLFVLIGLQLPTVVDGLHGFSTLELVKDAVLVSGAVVVARMLWIFPGTYLPRWLSRRVRERDPSPPWQVPTLIGWTGMRGAVSLAAALALPFNARHGAFERRDLIIFLTFSTILVTLIAQGLSLPWVIGRLGFGTEDETAREDADGRLAAAEAAIARINELAGEDWVREDTAERLRAIYEYRRNRFSARFDDDVDEGELEERSLDYQRLRREVLEAERRRIVELRDEGIIGDETMRRIERDLDLEDARLEI